MKLLKTKMIKQFNNLHSIKAKKIQTTNNT